jgi:hypothetical protein
VFNFEDERICSAVALPLVALQGMFIVFSTNLHVGKLSFSVLKTSTLQKLKRVHDFEIDIKLSN